MKLKKINIDFYISALLIIAVVLLIVSLIIIVFSFFYFNAINKNKSLIDEFINNSPVEKIQIKKAEMIINYAPEDSLINQGGIVNPFKVF